MATKKDKEKEKDSYAKLMDAIGLGSGGTTKKSATSSTPSASSASAASSSSSKGATSSKGSGPTSYDKLMNSLGLVQKTSIAEDGEKKDYSRKEKWNALWQNIGKNAKAGAYEAANAGSIKSQQRYWTRHDPTSERGDKTISARNSEIADNSNYNREHLLNFLFDTSRDAGREHNEGSYFTQEDNDRYMQGVEQYAQKQQQLDTEAQAATQNAFDVIDPDTKIGQIALSASGAVARTLPSMAVDAAITAASAGTLAPMMMEAGFSRFAIRLASELPATTVRTLRYFDDAFQTALDSGATQEQAVKAASQTALPNAVIESAGGLDALAGKLVGVAGKTAATAGKVGKVAKVAKALEVPLSEGVEESLQGIVERNAAKAYDEESVAMDLQQIANDFALGAAGGAILGSAMGILRRGLNANSQQELKAAMEEQGVPPQTAEQASAAMLDAISKRTAPPAPPTTAEQGMSLMGNAAQTTGPVTTAEQGADLINNGVHTWREAMRQPEQPRSTNAPLVFSKTPAESGEKIASNPEQVQTTAPTQKNAAEPLASGENGTTGGQPTRTRGTYGLTVQEGEGKEQQYGIMNTLGQAVEAGVVDEELEKAMEGRTYATVSNPQVQAAARNSINKFGVDRIRNYLMRIAASNQNFNSTQYAAAIELVHHYSANGDFDTADTIMQAANQAVNDAGRLVELTKTLAQASPEFYVQSRTRSIKQSGHRALSEGRQGIMRALATAEQQISNGSWDGRVSFNDVETIKKPGRAGIIANPAEPKVTQDPGVTEKEKQQRLDAVAEIYKDFNIPYKIENGGIEIDAATEQEQKEKAAAFAQTVLDETSVSLDEWLERINLEVQASAVRTPMSGRVGAARRINMLLQTVSLLVRNPVGNIDQGLREQIADYPAWLIGKGLQVLLGGDVNSVNIGKYGELGEGMKRGWKEVNLARKTGTLKLIGHKYGDNESNLDRLDGGEAKNAGAEVIGKAQRQIDDFLTYILCLGDLSFVEGRQNQVEAQYAKQNTKANAKTEQVAQDFIDRAGGTENALKAITDKINGEVLLTDEEKRAAVYLAHAIESGELPQESLEAADGLTQKLQKAAGTRHYYTGLTEEQKKLADVAGHTITYTQKGGGSTLATTLRSLGQMMEYQSAKDTEMTGPGPVILGKIIDAVMRLEMPFVQVAGNLMGSIWNYSVGSVVNPLVETTMEAVESSVYDGHVSLKNMSLARQRRIAVGIGRGLIGVGIMLGGQLFARALLATGDEPEKNSLESKIWKAEGKIGDSIKIGNSWVNLTALAPSFTLLAIGATLWQNAEEKKDPDTAKLILHLMDQWFGIPGMIADNIADDNLWEGFIELVKSIGDDNGPDLDYLAERVLGNGVSQLIPFSGLMRRFAYAIDPYVRDTSAEDSFLDWKWQVNKVKAGIPWLSETLPAQVDVDGNPVVRYPNADTGWKRATSALLNPATKTSKDRSNDPFTKDLVALARETDDKNLLIGNAPYKLKGNNDEIYKLFGQERNLYQTELTTTYNDYLRELFGDPAYKYLTTDQKDKVARNLMDLSVYEAEKVIDDRNADFAIKDTTDRAKLKAKIDEAAAATNEKGENLNIDVVTYLIHNAATSGIDALDDNGETVNDLGKARKAVAAKNADKGATPEQAYYLWRTMGNDDPFADKDQFYWYYFNGWEWNGRVYTDEEVTDRILHPEKY